MQPFFQRCWRGVGLLSLMVLSACAATVAAPTPAPMASLCHYGFVPVHVNGIVEIYGELCTPPTGPTKTVMVMVSGLTYSHLYWDWPSFNGVDYSAMRYYSALDQRQGQGYSTFAFDRIGIGLSDHPQSSLVTVQSNVAVLHQLIQVLRAGKLPLGPTHSFAQVILLGHSFGSILSEQDASRYPYDADAVVLTGELHQKNTQIAPLEKLVQANRDPSHRFGTLDAGYLTSAPGSLGPLFYADIGVSSDPAVVRYNETTKETMSLTELKTLPVVAQSKGSLAIVVPVLEVVGQQDAINCVHAVDCSTVQSVFREEAPYFSAAAHLQVQVEPGVGHDLNLHYAALAVYAQIQQWALAQVAP